MAWTAIPDKSTGDLMDETWYDTHFKANMEFLKDAVDTAFPSLTNDTGGAISAGYVGIINSAASTSVTSTTTAGDNKQAAVAKETIANGSAGLFYSSGHVCDVNVTGAVALYDKLQTSGTAGKAQVGDKNYFAFALETSGGGDATIKAFMVPVRREIRASATRTSALTITSGAYRACTLTDEEFDTDDMFTPTSEVITIPADGDYMVAYLQFWAGTAGSVARIGRVDVNSGARYILTSRDQGSGNLTTLGAGAFSFSAGDTLALLAQITSSSEGINEAVFSVYRIH